MTIGTDTITLDPSADVIQVGAGITIDATNQKIIVGDSEVADSTGNAKFTGIVTAKSFTGFDQLAAPYSSTTTITVTVANKVDGEHRYYGQGSSQGYVLDNVKSPFLTLTPGKTYRFSGSVEGVHPFRFYYDADRNYAYTTGVTVGSGYVDLEVTDTTPTVLHYQCSSHSLMGNAIQVNSNYLDVKTNSSIVGVLTATSFVGGLTGNVTGNVTGNLTGDVSGNVTGNVTGNLTGNVNASGISTFTNNIQLKSGDGDPARVDFYCESGNSHYTRLKSAPHSEYSGNVSIVLPIKSGDVIVGDTSGNITQNINTSGIITATSFIGNVTGNLTGTASVATLATNAQGLTGTPSISVVDIASRHINSSGVVTATSFVGDGSGLTGLSSGIAGISTTGTSVFNNINSSGVVTATTFVGNLTGNPTGTIQTASQPNITSLGTLSSLNVSGNVSIGGTLTYEDVTSIDSVGLITARSGMVVSGVSTFLGSQKGINVVGVSSFAGAINANGGVVGNVTGDASGNAGTATKLATARTIGGVSFDGSAAINLPGVNTSGNQDTSGNAATATVSVNAQGLTGSPNIQVGNVTVTGDLTVQGTTNSETSTDTTVTGIMTARSINVGAVGGIGVTFDQGGGVFSGIVTSHTVKASNALYLPLYTTTTRDAGSFTQGAVIFNTTVKKLEYYDGTSWKSIPEVSTGLVLALDS